MSRGVRWTEQDLAAVLRRQERLRRPGAGSDEAPAASGSVHTRARRTSYNGRVYASGAEAARAVDLDILLRLGEILSWEAQPLVIILWPGTDQVLLRYRADFRVMGLDRRYWYEEIKGRRFRDWPVRERILRCAGLPLRVLPG